MSTLTPETETCTSQEPTLIGRKGCCCCKPGHGRGLPGKGEELAAEKYSLGHNNWLMQELMSKSQQDFKSFLHMEPEMFWEVLYHLTPRLTRRTDNHSPWILACSWPQPSASWLPVKSTAAWHLASEWHITPYFFLFPKCATSLLQSTRKSCSRLHELQIECTK